MLRMRFSELCMRIIYSSVRGPTIKINKNKPGEHIKCNVKWFNVDLLLQRPLSLSPTHVPLRI